jgi:hypothetical protein
MSLYLDTEFNGLGGSLISMALVSEDGQEWYEVCHLPEPQNINPWVAEHVVPLLAREPVDPVYFTDSLGLFLRHFRDIEIIADWPADFEHFSAVMAQYGARHDFEMPFEYAMRFIKGSPDIKPETPHNALSDARALRDWHQSTLKPELYVGDDGELILKKGAAS